MLFPLFQPYHHHQHRRRHFTKSIAREGIIIEMDFHLLHLPHLPGQHQQPAAGDASDAGPVRCGCGSENASVYGGLR
jgi:hypothetical protein